MVNANTVQVTLEFRLGDLRLIMLSCQSASEISVGLFRVDEVSLFFVRHFLLLRRRWMEFKHALFEL